MLAQRRKMNGVFFLAVICCVILVSKDGVSQSKPLIQQASPVPAYSDRNQIPDQYKWDLTELFPDDAAWGKDAKAYQNQLSKFGEFKGHLGDSADVLSQALTDYTNNQKQLKKFVYYARFSGDIDTRSAQAIALKQQSDQLEALFTSTTSFLVPEILSLSRDKVLSFAKLNTNLGVYEFYFDNLFRMNEHTGDAKEEQLLTQAGPSLGLATRAYNTFFNAEVPFLEIQLSTGEKVTLSPANFSKYRSVQNSHDRSLVFQSFFKSLNQFKETFGALLFGHIQQHLFYKTAHHYDSSLQAALEPDNIPTTVYTQLIDGMHQNLPTFHRYLALRKKIMGIAELRYEDLYVPLMPDVDKKYSVEEAKEIVLKAVDPLGPQVNSIIKDAYDHRWIDYFTTPGKMTGAYSKGLFQANHPHILLNYDGSYSSLGTLSHELGHSVHSFLVQNSSTPDVYKDYSTFVSEVASMTNESLLFKYILSQATTKTDRLNLLGARLEFFRKAFVRQVMLAGFELRVHEQAEKGDALTGESLKKTFLDIVRQYHGHEQGICRVDEIYGMEWASIPHFFKYNFMLFQYATSLTASSAIANKIVEEERATPAKTVTRDAYIKMLSLGGSQYPIDLLKGMGIDMTTSGPLEAAISEMNQMMDEIEKLLTKG